MTTPAPTMDLATAQAAHDKLRDAWVLMLEAKDFLDRHAPDLQTAMFDCKTPLTTLRYLESALLTALVAGEACIAQAEHLQG